MINEIIWRALGRASIPSKKEPLGLTREDGKRPDGVTLIPWSCGRCLDFRIFHPSLTERLQFRVHFYLALLITLLIRRIRHFTQILLICSGACELGCPSSFE